MTDTYHRDLDFFFFLDSIEQNAQDSLKGQTSLSVAVVTLQQVKKNSSHLRTLVDLDTLSTMSELRSGSSMVHTLRG